ncbi:hypothetical protein AVEN_70356-1, partial [Araneus ventricosus]
CGGLEVRSRPRDRRSAGSKDDSAEDSPCMGLLHAKSYVVTKRTPVGVARKFGEVGASSGVVLIIRPRFKITRSVPK